MSEAVRLSWRALEFASEEFMADRDIALLAVKQETDGEESCCYWPENPGSRDRCPEYDEYAIFEDNDDDCTHPNCSFHAKIHALSYFSDHIRGDQEIACFAVQCSKNALQFVSQELRSDKTVVLAAVNRLGTLLKFASSDLQGDHEIACVAVKSRGAALQYTSEILQGDINLALMAVNQNGLALEFASSELRSSKVLVEAALKQNGLSLQYASMNLRKDPDIAGAALLQNEEALRHVLCQKIVLGELTKNGNLLRFVSSSFLADKTFALAAISVAASTTPASLRGRSKGCLFLQYMSTSLKADTDVVLAAVQRDGGNLKDASLQLRADKLIALAAIQNSLDAVYYISKELIADKDLAWAVVSHKNLILENYYGGTLQRISTQLWEDEQFALAAAQLHGCNILRFLANMTALNNFEVVLAVLQHPNFDQNKCTLLKSPSQLPFWSDWVSLFFPFLFTVLLEL